ncbi:MAG: co-chaperone GroES [Dehalococcoidia bacterium]|nr:co-chaperone GroES [Dehalococcoidia bacterium]
MAKSFQPLGDRVLVKLVEAETKTKSGLLLPETAKEKPQEGEIVAVGPGRLTEEGKRLPLELKAGERVLFAKYAGSEIKEFDQDMVLLSERDILAKISGSR